MAAKKRKIEHAPKRVKFTGSLLLSSEPFDYTPDAFLDKLGFAKENRPVFTIRPMNAKERHFFEADQNNMTAEGMLWAKEKNIDIQDKSNLYMVVSKFSTFSDIEKRMDIVRSCIIGASGNFGSDFKKAEDGGMSEEMFDKLPDEIKTGIEAELMKRGRLTNDEVLGL